jgi:hypothetical protein
MTIRERKVEERLLTLEAYLQLILARINQLGKYGQFDPAEVPDDHEAH